MLYIEAIETFLSEAAEIARSFYGKIDKTTTKKNDNNQVLTEADLKIGQYLTDRIIDSFPDHNIIDEELGVVDKKSLFTWVIDPIDGTSNFAEGLPSYGILIGLLEGSSPKAGGIALPAFNKVYSGQTGQGAFMNGMSVRVSSSTDLLSSLVAYGIDGHQENPGSTYAEISLLADIILGIRNLRSSNSVYDQAMVIEGAYGASLNRTSKIWDNVAQEVLIKEAGGRYTDFFGDDIDYTNPLSKADQNFTWCAGAPALHERLQKIIHSNAAH